MDAKQLMALETLLDTEEVGELLNMTTRNVRYLQKRGTIPAVRIPGTRGLRFKPATIRALIDAAEDENTL